MNGPTVVVGSVSGAPGVSVTALGIAATWPAPVGREAGERSPAVLVEADPAGGVLAPRFGLAAHPGLIGLAADARRIADPHLVARHAQVLWLAGHGVEVVVAPPGWSQPRVALPVILSPAGPVLRHARPAVVVDAGRLHPAAPTWPLLAGASLVVLVTARTGEAIAAVHAALPDLRAGAGDRLLLLLGPDGDYPPADIQAALAVPVLGALPEDPRGAKVFTGRLEAGPRWRRLPLPRATAGLAAALTARLPAAPGTAAPVTSVPSTQPAGR